MKRETLTLVGRASKLAFADGTATWTIAVRQRRHTLANFDLQAFHSSVLEQFESMDEGQLIGVIVELPPLGQRVPGAALTVTRLELLGKPVAQEVAHA